MASSDNKSTKQYKTRSASKAAAAVQAAQSAAALKNGKRNKQQSQQYKKKSHVSSDEDDDEEDEDIISESECSEEEEEDEDEECISSSEDDDDEEEEETDDDKLAIIEYNKFLRDLFPSKYMDNKIQTQQHTMGSMQRAVAAAMQNVKTPYSSRKKTCNTICPGAPKKNKSTNSHASAAKKKKNKPAAAAAYEEDLYSDEDEEEDEDYEEEEADEMMSPQKFNISFIIEGRRNSRRGRGGPSYQDALYDEEYDEEEEEDEEDDEYTDEDKSEEETCSCTSCSESEDEEEEEVRTSKSKANTKKGKKSSTVNSEPSTPNQTEPEKQTKDKAVFAKIKGLFGHLTAEEQQNPVVKSVIKKIKDEEKQQEKKMKKITEKEKTKNTQKLKALLREKDVMNDLKYFHEKMSVEEQDAALKQIELIKQHSDVTKPYRLTLLDADIPPQYKASAYRKISTLRFMEPGGGEYYKMKNWVDAFMKIPFGKYKNLPITLNDGVDKCHDFMTNAKKILDDAVYGLNDAKLQIMQMVGQWLVNPEAIGTAIAIKGPMGTGKTTLVKEGISKILGRDFAFIALGGATDSSFLEGHSYTYEGSAWGKIVDLLINCKSMNPVIYFDELDKISDTPKGDEIVGILTHLTDTAQNNQFHDRYFSEINFDLSRCLFIFSYNDESKVNRILLDRMYRIQTKGYDQAQKTTIANNYLLPKIREQVVFKTDDITISESTMHHIITNYTDKEDGVRTLKRCLEIIHTKLNLYRLMKPDANLFENEMLSIKVEFPIQVTSEMVDKLIKKEGDCGSWKNMYM